MTGPTIGSLCSGIGGLELGLEQATGGNTLWNCEIDPFCRRILARHWPHARQYEDVKDVDERTERVDLVCAGFPCFPEGTLITTAEGLTPIEKVRKGDKVLTHKRRWRPVVSTMSRLGAPLWKVLAFGALPILTTDEHPFFARRKRRKWNNKRRRYDCWWDPPSWVPARELTKEHYLAQPVSLPRSGHRSWLTPSMAYLIGRWLGDGGVVNQRLEPFGRGAHRKKLPGWLFGLPTQIEGRTVRQRDSYLLRLSSENHQAFHEDGFMWVPVREVRRTRRRSRVFNLEVQQDNSYVAGSFVVHNCQDISIAGTRKGLDGERSGLWHECARVVRALRPRFVFLENVPALRHLVLDRGLGRVLGDLAESGYDAEWDCVPAAAVGAPHVRDRIFVLGWLPDVAHAASQGRGPRTSGSVGAGQRPEDGPAACQDRTGRSVGDADEAGRAERRRTVAAEAQESAAQRPGSSLPGGHDHEWPPPPGHPSWPEWLLRHPSAQPGIRRGHDGLPDGVDENRRARLRALGNAVVPQAAARAWELLVSRAGILP